MGSILFAFLVGLATQPRQKFDNIFSEELTNHLFQAKNSSFGLDLVALNIQRGRDHGLPGYTEYRDLCGLPPVSSFSDLSDVMTPDQISALSLVYEDVLDIDLYVGGLMEAPDQGSILGPTFSCLFADQFLKLKIGDRFFFSNEGSASGFTAGNLPKEKKYKMGSCTILTLCDMCITHHTPTPHTEVRRDWREEDGYGYRTIRFL